MAFDGRHFVGLLLAVPVLVGPIQRLLVFVLALIFEAAAELVVDVADALEDLDVGGVIRPAGGHREVELAVAADAETGVRHAAANEAAQARGAAGDRIDPPLAAVADHEAGIERVDRAAQRTVRGRPEELADELPGLGVPRADALRRGVGLRNPERARGIHGDSGDERHAVLLPGADQAASAGAADGAEQLAKAIEDLDLVLRVADADIDLPRLVDGDARRVAQVRDDGAMSGHWLRQGPARSCRWRRHRPICH